MIIGIGTDIVSIDRIRSVLGRHGDRFRNRIFTERERAHADNNPDGAPVFAKRWAAKEACSKALGTGMRQGVAWRDMEILVARSGMPRLELRGNAKARAENLAPRGHRVVAHVSVTDDNPWSAAIVVLEAVAE